MAGRSRKKTRSLSPAKKSKKDEPTMTMDVDPAAPEKGTPTREEKAAVSPLRRSRRRSTSDISMVSASSETSKKSPSRQRNKSPSSKQSIPADTVAADTISTPKQKASSAKKASKAAKRTPGSSPRKSESNEVKESDTPDQQVQGSNVNKDEEKNSTPPAKQTPTLDTTVHRLRHLDFIPSEVLAMSACKTISSNHHNNSGYFAVSRADGSIELLEATSIPEYVDKKKWTPHMFPLTKIAGSKRAVANSLCWVQVSEGGDNSMPACVAASADGTLWTVHFENSQLQSRITSGGGGVFDLTTCVGTKLPLVAGACQDGSVRIWQVSKQKKTLLEPPIATLTTAGSATLSLAWRIVKQEKDKYETVIFAGVADGTIRKYQLDLQVSATTNSGEDDAASDMVQVLQQTALQRMTVESRGRRTPTKVWTMQVLQDDTLVTGNSLGQVQFWNTTTCTLTQSINQTETKADVLKLVVNTDETKVFASGVDARVVCLERQKVSSVWKFSTAQRPHTHDIKSMIVVHANGPTDKSNLEALVTGGVDTKLCTYVVSDFSKRRPRVWYPWPCESPISTSADSSHLLSMQRDSQIELFRLGDPSKPCKKSACELVGEIAIDTASNLVASTLSPNGQWLAVCNATSLFVFLLETTNDGQVQPRRMKLPKRLERISAAALHICHNNSLLIADASHQVLVVRLTEGGEFPVTVLTVPSSTIMSKDLPYHSVKASKTGKYIVAMSKSKEQGIHIFCKDNETYRHHWTIPSLAKARPADLCFLGDDQLAVATVSFEIYVFDLSARKLSPWSEQNGFPIIKWPLELSNRKDSPVRLSVNPRNPSQLIMSSFGAFVVVDMKGSLPKHCRMVPEMHVRRRRKRPRDDEEVTKSDSTVISPSKQRGHGRVQDPDMNKCTVCLHYNSMLYLDFIGDNEMVVVEQPWLRVISSLPDALHRRVYGCN